MSEKPTTDNVNAPSGESPTAAAATTQTHGENAPLNLTEELTQAQKQRDECLEKLDKLQRSLAESENKLKRTKSQAETDRVYAVGSLARDMLDGLDNLERAAEALRGSAASGIVDGLTMVHKQLVGILAKHGVEPIEALGQAFDPNQHEAIAQQPDQEKPEGTVVAEFGKGFRINDRVLRPSKVAVSIKPAS